ncbi:MAG: cytidine/deoxycytidylate deaminase family protein [Dethiobacteria bacterium]|nr:cytidine/deoxycytidylate deaminase family protein [Dethiobacteria bacterium]
MDRPDWDNYFMQIATVVATRSTCSRRQVGALLVQNKRILSTGYNGAPSGLSHCLEVGCLREKLQVPSGERHELCRGLHAEQNAIIQAAVHGVAIKDAVLYCTHYPCSLCAKMLVNAGVRTLVLATNYPDDLAKELFAEAGIEVRFIV